VVYESLGFVSRLVLLVCLLCLMRKLSPFISKIWTSG